MAQEYRFLRFEVSGIATILYAIALALPFVGDKLIGDFLDQSSFFLAFVGGAFILSLPFGYAIHQIAVNRYRRGKKEGRRPGVEYAEKIITEDQEFKRIWDRERDVDRRIAFVMAIMEVGFVCTDRLNSEELHDRRETRWSHYYARRAVGFYSPIFGFILFLIFTSTYVLVGGHFVFSWLRFLIFLAILATMIYFSFFYIIRYSGKLWEEICYLELVCVKLSEPAIREIMPPLIDHIKSVGKLPSDVRSNPAPAWAKTSRFGGN